MELFDAAIIKGYMHLKQLNKKMNVILIEINYAKMLIILLTK